MYRNKFGQKMCTHGSNEMCRRRHKREFQTMQMISRKRILTSRKG
jgi:hypothetical protein